MKKALHIFIGLVLLAILVAQGAALIHMAYQPEYWRDCVETMRQHRGWGMLVGVGLLGLVAMYLLTSFYRRTPEKDQYLAFHSSGATVSILLRAVSEFITKIGDEFAAILSMKTEVLPRGRSIDINLDLKVRAGTQIPELCQLLQERVRESVKINLGLSDIKNIRVQVKDIVGDTPMAEELTEDETL
jgi:uncharacterized alkaline shock family protein YloU